jgi:hypothetical protein
MHAHTQVMDVCLKVNPRLVVKRARFSALVARELHAAVANLVLPNKLDADAVRATHPTCCEVSPWSDGTVATLTVAKMVRTCKCPI